MPDSPCPKTKITTDQRLESLSNADVPVCNKSSGQPGQSLLAALDKFANDLDREILRILRS